jgi:hypothetical protein
MLFPSSGSTRLRIEGVLEQSPMEKKILLYFAEEVI